MDGRRNSLSLLVPPRQLAREADDALAGLFEAVVADGQRDAQMAGRARPEAVGRENRDALALEQALGEFLGAEAAGADVEQHEHAALGRGDPTVRRRGEDAGHQRGPAAIVLM